MGLSRMFFEVKARKIFQNGDFLSISGFIAMKAKEKRMDGGKTDFLPVDLKIYKKADVDFTVDEGDTVFGWASNFYLNTYTSKKNGEIKPILELMVWSPYDVRVRKGETMSGYVEADNQGLYDNGFKATDMGGMGSGEYAVDISGVPF